MRSFKPPFSPPALVSAPGLAKTSALPQVSLLMPILSPLSLSNQTLAVDVPAGRALTVHVRRAGVLRLNGARVWLTFTGPDAKHPQASTLSDLFLLDGHEWALEPGQSLVLEPFAEPTPGRCSAEDASRLSWEPAPSLAAQCRSVWRRWLAGTPALSARPDACASGWQTVGS